VLNSIYNPTDHKFYYEQDHGLYKIDLDGSDIIQLLAYSTYGNQSFGLTTLHDHITSFSYDNQLRIININTGNVDFMHSLKEYPILDKIAQNGNKVFYVYNSEIYYYDLSNQLNFKIPNTTGVNYGMCPNWDGRKIFFIANLRVN